MSLVRFSNPLPSVFHRFPRMLDRFADEDLFDWATRNFSETNTTLPSVNIKEGKDGYDVEMAAPGFERDDFKIDLSDDVLTISSEKKMEQETKEGEQYTKREFSYQSFSRSFSLPSTVNNDKIAAKYENGMLRIMLPKREEAIPKPIKHIAIS